MPSVAQVVIKPWITVMLLVILLLLSPVQMSGDMATDHVNGNGTEEPMDTTAAVTHSEHFPALLEAGLPQKVAEKLDELYVAGKQKFHFGCALLFSSALRKSVHRKCCKACQSCVFQFIFAMYGLRGFVLQQNAS